MKTHSTSDNTACLITRQSMLVLLSAGAFFICGSYIIDGLGENAGSAGEPYSVSRHLNSQAGQYAASTDNGDENGGYSTGYRLVRFSGFSAGHVIAGPLGPCWHSGHCTDIAVNPFKYESHFGFSPLRSPPFAS
ncbi:MAG: hypothetical protein KC473_10390 [Candidatus Dadabacteria bacterium]|nr:hypothetical protein [Candidatus Dadabacteria bacterium]